MTTVVVILNSPSATNQLYSITITCTIHPDSTADQCVVMAMADGRVSSTGTSHIFSFHKLTVGTYIYIVVVNSHYNKT